MLCFPELALTGYECGEEAKKEQKPCAMHTDAAETIPGPSAEEIAKLAKELDIYAIFGMPEKDTKDPNVKYISAAVVGPEGILGSYRKILLASPPLTEEYCFKPGNELPIFESKKYGPIGVQICADYWMLPAATQLLALKGARIIFNTIGSAAAPGKIDMIRSDTTARAQAIQAYIVSCNHVGTERTISYYGHSTIGGPGFPKFNKAFAQSESIEEIVWATLSFETLHASRNRFRFKDPAKYPIGVIAKEYQQIAESMGQCRK